MISYVALARLDDTDNAEEARLLAGLSVQQTLELCDISPRTWYRWKEQATPRWAVRLILSQRATLDRFGWKSWEIRSGSLYCNELSYRYFWEPANLLAPLWGIDAATLASAQGIDNVSSLDAARKTRQDLKTLPKLPQLPSPTIKDYA